MRPVILALALIVAAALTGCASTGTNPDGSPIAVQASGPIGDFLANLTPQNVANTIALLNEKVGQLNETIGKGEAVALAFQAAADAETDPAKRQANADKARAKLKDVDRLRADLTLAQTLLSVAQTFAGPATQPAK